MKKRQRDEWGMHKLREDSFEGWYIRLDDEAFSLAVIVGYSNASLHPHAFIQTIDTITHKTQYISYPLHELHASNDPFRLILPTLEFTQNTLSLHLPDAMIPIEIDVSFTDFHVLQSSRYAPTIMGPFAYVKQMECVHGILSLHHHIEGSISIQHQEYQIQGSGYIEKDRGTSFPKNYIWLQSSHCIEQDATFFLAYAHIPFFIHSFQGLICVLYISGHQYRFSTYDFARVTMKDVDKDHYHLEIKQGAYHLSLMVTKGNGYPLLAPKHGMMGPKVYEGLDGEIALTLTKGKEQIANLHFLRCGNEDYLSTE